MLFLVSIHSLVIKRKLTDVLLFSVPFDTPLSRMKTVTILRRYALIILVSKRSTDLQTIASLSMGTGRCL